MNKISSHLLPWEFSNSNAVKNTVNKTIQKEGTTVIKKINNVAELINANKTDTVSQANTLAKEVIAPVADNNMPVVLNAPSLNKTSAAPKPTYDIGTKEYRYEQAIEDILTEAGIEYDELLVQTIYVEIINANIDPNAPVKLTTHASIADVTRLIDINLSQTELGDILSIKTVTGLIDTLLERNADESYSTDAEVRQFILDKANELRPAPAETEEPVNQVNVDAFFNKGDGTELTVFQIYDNRYYNGEDQVAKTINNAFVSVAKERGIYFDLTEYKNFIAETIKNIHNIAGVENTEPPVLKKEAMVKYLESHTLEDLVKLIGSNEPVDVTPTTGGGTEPPAAQKTNADAFFGGKETVGSADIYNNRNSNFGGDAVANGIMTAINDVAQELHIDSSDQNNYTKLINAIITMVNNALNVTNTNPPVLTKDNLNKYFENHTLDDLKTLIASDAVKNAVGNVSQSEVIPPPASSNVNLDELFKNGETLTAEIIVDNKFSYLNSDDTVTKEIMTAINDVAKNLRITSDPTYYKFLVNAIITKINDITGTQNTNPPALSKETLNKYFTNYTLDNLKDITKSKEIENAFWMEALANAGFDEVIGDFDQDSNQGDCYLCATMKSLSTNEYGQALIKDLLGTEIIDGELYLTVTFKGGFASKNNSEANSNWTSKTKTYYFKPSVILDAKKNAKGNWANGKDNIEMILIEKGIVAMLEDQVYTTPPTNGYGNRYLYGGTPMMVMHLLTGDCGRNTTYDSSGSAFKQHALDLLNRGLIEEGTTGNYMMHIGFKGHACSILGITGDGIKYVNPYDTSEVLFLSWDTITSNPSIYNNFQWAKIPVPKN